MSDVREFGAVGDGKTDDTRAIQRVLTEGDGLLKFPRGEYRITRPLEGELRDTGRLAVNGSGGVAKLIMDGPGPAVILKGTHSGSASPGDCRADEWMNERMPAISDIEIEGRHPGADGILIEGVMQPVLSGLLIREVNTAIRLEKVARNVLIDRCQIYHNRNAGVHLYNLNLHQVNITGSHISYCRRGGIRVEKSEIRNLQITGNDIEYNNNRTHGDNPPDGASADIYIDAREGRVREGTIAGNTIQATCSPGGANIRFIGRGPQENLDTGLFSISGNLIGTQEHNIHITAAYGIIVDGNAVYGSGNRNILVENSRNIIISQDIFDHPAYHREGAGGGCTGISMVNSCNCNVCGVVIQDCRGDGNIRAGSPRQGLLEFFKCRKINVSGSQFLDGFPYGIYLKDCTETIISGCIILDERERKRMLAPVLWEGRGEGSMFKGNRAGEGLEGGVKISSCEVRQSDNL